MSTFLQLAQAVARESGTVSDLTAPSNVTGQTGRLLRIVNWTADGYADIQRRRDDWRWLRKEFDGETIATVQRYTASNLSISSRFKNWIFEDDRGENTFSAQKTSEARSTETWLTYVPWAEFRRIYLFGSAADDTGKPSFISVDPAGQIVLHPIPDAAHRIRGEYYRAPQILTANDDVPEMPPAHHDAIKWSALILMGTFDEAMEQVPAWVSFLNEHLASLVRKQTPRIVLGGPLA